MGSRYVAERATRMPLSGIRVIFEMVHKMKDVVRLEAGDPDFKTPDHICEAAKKALDEGYTHYTSSFGMLELRQALARKLKKDNGIDADPETEIVVTAGASCAVNIAILSTIDPGDEVLIPDPSWPHYEACVALADGVAVHYPLLEKNQFRADIEDIRKRITRKTKMIVVNSPSNPTGGFMEKRDIEAVAETAKEYNLLVLSDEVYEKIVYDQLRHISVASLPDMKERTITVNSFSKTYAMTGWRLGYAVARQEIAEEMAKLNLYSNSCPSSIAQRAGIAALSGPQDAVVMMAKEYERRRNEIVKGLNEIEGITCVKPRGAFYAFPNVSSLGMSSQDAAMFILKEAKVSTVPGSGFGGYGEGYLRLAYSNSIENIVKALVRIRNAVEKIRIKS
ncbi:MAG: pyridoxal phosphate-dependent aminotransferase [Candidatus Bathyarchaeia archaeon]